MTQANKPRAIRSAVEKEDVPESARETAAADDANSAVAVYTGLELKLPRGGIAAFLICSAAQGCSGFFAKGAKPSDEDEDQVSCPHCKRPHYVVSLMTALEEDSIDLAEGGPCVDIGELLAFLLREGEASEG
jgi:hypothetical protein